MNSNCFADVIFNVGKPPNQKKFYSHKFLLLIYSDVLQAIFSNSSIEKNHENQIVINLEDVEKHIFEIMLTFIYTEKLNVDNLLDAIQVFYLAEKYNIYPIMFECKSIIEAELAADNVCVAYRISLLTADEDLIANCEKIIKNETMKVLKSKYFLLSPLSIIEKIASFNFLNIPNEFFLFQAILLWAREEASRSRRGIKPTSDILRHILNPILPKIRFLSMTHNQLFSSPVTNGILSKEEVATIAMHKSEPTRFPILPLWCNRLQNNRTQNFELDTQSLKFCWSFKKTTTTEYLYIKFFIIAHYIDIYLEGFNLCMKNATEVPDLYIAEQTKTLQPVDVTKVTDKNELDVDSYELKLVKPVLLKKNRYYCVKIETEESVTVCDQPVEIDKLHDLNYFMDITFIGDTNCHIRDILISSAAENNSNDSKLEKKTEKPNHQANYKHM